MTTEFETNAGGIASAIWAAVWVLIQCIVATSASTTFCTVALWALTQLVRASTPAVGT